MCSSKANTNTHQYHNRSSSRDMEHPSSVPRINGRPVLQPTCNRLQRRHNHSLTTTTTANKPVTRAPKLSPSPPISPMPISPPITRSRPPVKSPTTTTPSASPPSSALAGKLQLPDMRKLRIAHYGRRTKGGDHKARVTRMEKRCNFITPSSDLIYVTYHDEEWGVPVHDDNLLFELLVLTTAQIGSEWTSILKRRELLRDAFSGFDAETVATFTERRIASISCNYGIELSQVRGAVENAKQILKIKKEYASFDKYLWQYVNFKPIATEYRTCQKIPVKTSKSEAISKDLVKRGFRFVGPAVIHSFMQAVGLTNDHIVSCPRHLHCSQLAQNP